MSRLTIDGLGRPLLTRLSSEPVTDAVTEACHSRLARKRFSVEINRTNPSRSGAGPRERGRVTGVPGYAAEGVLHEGWQILIAVAVLAITAIGLARLLSRGPTRMANGIFVTGFLIVAITVVGTLAVSCSGASDARHASHPSR